MRVEDGYSAVRRAPVVGLRGQAEGCVGADDGLARIGMRGPIFRGTIAASAELANSSCHFAFDRIQKPDTSHWVQSADCKQLILPPAVSEQKAREPEDPCGHSRPPSVVTHA